MLYDLFLRFVLIVIRLAASDPVDEWVRDALDALNEWDSLTLGYSGGKGLKSMHSGSIEE